MPESPVTDGNGCCDRAAELLPFHLNRSLEEDEARWLERQLRECAGCRRQEQETRTAMALYEGHLPVEDILDYAFDAPMSRRHREVIQSHLASCDHCSVELDAVRPQTTTEAVTEAPVTVADPLIFAAREPKPTPARRWVAVAWAACLLAVVNAVGWMWSWNQLEEQRALPRSLPSARANLAVVELLPSLMDPLRTGVVEVEEINRLPAVPEELVLMLLAGGRSCPRGCVLERYDADEKRASWRLEGLVPSPDGHLTLAVPGDWLPRGRVVLTVRDPASGELLAEYVLDNQETPDG